MSNHHEEFMSPVPPFKKRPDDGGEYIQFNDEWYKIAAWHLFYSEEFEIDEANGRVVYNNVSGQREAQTFTHKAKAELTIMWYKREDGDVQPKTSWRIMAWKPGRGEKSGEWVNFFRTPCMVGSDDSTIDLAGHMLAQIKIASDRFLTIRNTERLRKGGGLGTRFSPMPSRPQRDNRDDRPRRQDDDSIPDDVWQKMTREEQMAVIQKRRENSNRRPSTNRRAAPDQSRVATRVEEVDGVLVATEDDLQTNEDYDPHAEEKRLAAAEVERINNEIAEKAAKSKSSTQPQKANAPKGDSPEEKIAAADEKASKKLIEKLTAEGKSVEEIGHAVEELLAQRAATRATKSSKKAVSDTRAAINAEGYDAFAAGKLLTDNPYSKDLEKGPFWTEGWETAQAATGK